MTEFEKMKQAGYASISFDSNGNVIKNDVVDIASLKETSEILNKMFYGKNEEEVVDEWIQRKRKEYIEKHGSIAMDFITPPDGPLVEVSFRTGKENIDE